MGREGGREGGGGNYKGAYLDARVLEVTCYIVNGMDLALLVPYNVLNMP